MKPHKHYVCPVRGDDANDGSKQAPFRTIRRAQEETWELQGDTNRQIINILSAIPGSPHRLDETLRFTSLDSSLDRGKPVIWRGPKGKKARITSLHPLVCNWVLHAELPRGNIYRTRLRCECPFHALFVNGRKCVRARWPKNRPASMLAYTPVVSASSPVRDHILVQDGDQQPIFEGSKAEVVTLQNFAPDRLPILRYDGNKLLFAKPSIQGINSRADYAGYYIENYLEALTEPGEFYYDQSDSTLYFMPSKQLEGELGRARFEIPILNRLLSIEGDTQTFKWSEKFSVSCRFRTDFNSSDSFWEKTILTTRESAANGFRIGLRKQNGVVGMPYVMAQCGAVNHVLFTELANLNDGKVHELKIEFDLPGKKITASVDGGAPASRSLRVTANFDDAAPRIGYSFGSTYWKGALSNIMAEDAHGRLFEASLNGEWWEDCQFKEHGYPQRVYSWDNAGKLMYSNPVTHAGETVFNGTSDFITWQGMPGDAIRYIQFLNLAFCGTDRPPLGDGHTGYGDHYVRNAGEAVLVRNAKHIHFTNCEIGDVEATGIWFDQCQRCSFNKGKIKWTGYDGIAFTGRPHCVVPSLSSHNQANGNTISEVGQVRFNGQAIHYESSTNFQANDNTIYGCPYSGIRNYGYLSSQYWPSGGSEIARNDICSVMRVLRDGAAIHMSGWQMGTHIHHNRLTWVAYTDTHVLRPDQSRQAGGIRTIYMDEGTCHALVEYNYLKECGTEGIFLHLANHNTIQNNIILEIDPEVGRGSIHLACVGVDHYKDGSEGPVKPRHNTICRNICYNSMGQPVFRLTGQNLADLQAMFPLGEHDQNLLWPDTVNIHYYSGGLTDITTITGLAAAHGLEANSITADPLLDATSYMPCPASKAFDLGFKVFEVPGA